MKSIDLTGRWQFKANDAPQDQAHLPKRYRSLQKWMKATVPGTVHTDLLALKKIPDPYYRMNELDLQWIDLVSWIYRREFSVDSEFLSADKVELVAEGLDTYVNIKINGTAVAETDNMFVTHRIDAKDMLLVGENVIEILFDSPTLRARALEEQYGKHLAAFDSRRVYVRKAQYSFGWDWGPRFPTSGVWLPIRLEARSVARVESAYAKVISLDGEKAVISVAVELEKYQNEKLEVRIQIGFGDEQCQRTWSGYAASISQEFEIPHPRLWWPNGYGAQPLYSLTVSVLLGAKEIDTHRSQFGIRQLRLLQEPDAEGKSFIFEINGERIFCKGADWIPADNFIPRIGEKKYRRLLTMANEANMNMLRVWGGGIYEQDIFYDLCDEFGIMVWQDFMYACATYPGEEWFVRKAIDEAESVVKRLRQHPSIAVWCGNNECEWGWHDSTQRHIDEMPGAAIFRDKLAEVCGRLDGTRPYWRTTPFGEGHPNDERNGNQHHWKVWAFWEDFREYQQSKPRFVTEFGFESPPKKETLMGVTLPSDRHIQSKVLEHHNKQVRATERLYAFLSGHFKVTGDYEDVIYKMQLVQAEALKCGVEHWRRRKFWTAGTLYWQLDDCWPVFSWSSIDYDLRPKASYYYTKRFYAPILVSLVENGDVVECWISNDTLSDVDGVFSVQSENLDGRILRKTTSKISVPKNSSMCVLKRTRGELKISDTLAQFLYARFVLGKEVLSENTLFFEEFKHITFPRQRLRWRLRRVLPSEYILEINADKFAKSVCIEVSRNEVWLSDNYFDLHPSHMRVIRIRCEKKVTTKQIRVRVLE